MCGKLCFSIELLQYRGVGTVLFQRENVECRGVELSFLLLARLQYVQGPCREGPGCFVVQCSTCIFPHGKEEVPMLLVTQQSQLLQSLFEGGLNSSL